MQFQFDSFAGFLDMGGHGFYIWLTYGLVIVGLVAVSLIPILQRKKFIKEQKMLAKRIQQDQLSARSNS